jgi:hypothetical protein
MLAVAWKYVPEDARLMDGSTDGPTIGYEYWAIDGGQW